MSNYFKAFIIAALTAFMVSACIKEPDYYSNPGNEDISDLVVPQSFTWSGVSSSDLLVTITSASGTKSLALDGQPVDLLDGSGNRISRTVVQNGEANFVFKFDSNVERLFISSPVIQTSVEVPLTAKTFNFVAPSNAAATFLALADSDADGMPDALDEFPSDPNKAYSVTFPATSNSGYQVENRAATELGKEDYYFQIFEDLWPTKGDYDLNDQIVASTIKYTYNGDGVLTNGRVVSKIWAVGADKNFPHGFGIEFFQNVGDNNLIYLPAGTVTLSENSLKEEYGKEYTHPDEKNANSIILWDNVYKAMEPYYNNVGGSWGVEGIPQTVAFNFDVNPDAKIKSLELLTYLFSTTDPTLVIRTFGSPPTKTTNMKRFGTSDDASPTTWNWDEGVTFKYPLSGEKAFYRTKENLPWAVEFVYSNFKVPIEETNFLEAYPNFKKWAESGGSEASDWYKSPVEGKVVTVGSPNTVTDIEGNVYNTVTIGTQVWMVENLKTTKYRTGEAIPNGPYGKEWGNLTTAAYCNYKNDANNVTTYGRLYNWYAATDSRNIAPTGWHVPTDAEWNTLTDYLGGESVAGGKLKESGTTHWPTPANTEATNISGFTALPGGNSNYVGTFTDFGFYGYWWTSTEESYALYRSVDYHSSKVYRGSSYKTYGFSVRCIKD